MRQCAGALVLRRGEVLLGKRSPDLSFCPGVWDVFGGHVEAGETPEQAMRRELEEELGITPGAIRPLGVLCSSAPSPDGYMCHLFAVAEWVGTPGNRAPAEHVEIRWFALDEATTLALAHPSYPDLFRSLAAEQVAVDG